MDIYLCFEGLDGSKPFNSLDCLSEVVLIRLAVGKFFLISALHLDATTPGDILKVGVVEGGFSTSSYQHTHTVGVSHLCFHLNLPDSGSCEAVLISSSRQSVLISSSSPWLSRRGFSLLPSPLLHFALLNCLSFLVGDGSGWGLVFIDSISGLGGKRASNVSWKHRPSAFPSLSYTFTAPQGTRILSCLPGPLSPLTALVKVRIWVENSELLV